MHVSAIACQCQASNRSQNFRGLWGNTEKKYNFVNYGTGSIDKINSTMHYYPFSDENQETIDKIVKDNKMHLEGKYTDGYPEFGYTEDVSVNVHPKLPFKVSEWAQFNKDKSVLSKSVRECIEESLKKTKIIY